MNTIAPSRTFRVSEDGDNIVAFSSLDALSKTNWQPGDRVVFTSGHTFQGSLRITGTPGPITIETDGLLPAVIRSGDQAGILIENASDVTVKNIKLVGSGYGKNKHCGLLVLNSLNDAKKLKGVHIERVSATGYGIAGIRVAGSAPDKGQCGFVGIKVLDCTADSNVYYGIHVVAQWDSDAKTYGNYDVEVRNCTVWDTSGDASFVDSHSGSGILVDNAVGAIIENCTAVNNGFLCACPSAGPCGIWMHAVDKGIIRGCVSILNKTGPSVDGAGFDFDAGVTNSICEYNFSAENDGAGYLMFTYSPAPHKWRNNVVRNCISINDGKKNVYSGIYVVEGAVFGRQDDQPVVGMKVESNLFISSPSDRGGQPACMIAFATTDMVVTGNVFAGVGATPTLVVGVQRNRPTFQKNTFWRSQSDPLLYHDDSLPIDTHAIVAKNLGRRSLETWSLEPDAAFVEVPAAWRDRLHHGLRAWLSQTGEGSTQERVKRWLIEAGIHPSQ
jgi:hypothetical protein